jgi:heptosyltransferase III
MSSAQRQYRGRILVIRGGAIGDFILTLPAIAALRSRFPDAYLEVLGYPHIVQLAVAGGLVDGVRPIEARTLAGFFASGGELAGELTDYFSEFDLIISYLYDPDGIFQANISRCSPAEFLTGPHRPNETEKTHATKVYLKPLERLAIFDVDLVPKLPLSVADPEPVLPLHTSAPLPWRLAVHPGSGSERKNWPETKWALLLRQLMAETTVHLQLVGGEAEGHRLQRLSAALPPERVRVAQSLPLAQLAHVLADCEGFIGHDSGISHLAAALGLPGLVLWGDTIEEIWRPPSERVEILRFSDGLAELSVEEVFSRLSELLGVNPGA